MIEIMKVDPEDIDDYTSGEENPERYDVLFTVKDPDKEFISSSIDEPDEEGITPIFYISQRFKTLQSAIDFMEAIKKSVLEEIEADEMLDDEEDGYENKFISCGNGGNCERCLDREFCPEYDEISNESFEDNDEFLEEEDDTFDDPVEDK